MLVDEVPVSTNEPGDTCTAMEVDVQKTKIVETEKRESKPPDKPPEIAVLNLNSKSKFNPLHWWTHSKLDNVYGRDAPRIPFSEDRLKVAVAEIKKSKKTCLMGYRPELSSEEKLRLRYEEKGFPAGKPLRAVKQCRECGATLGRVTSQF